MGAQPAQPGALVGAGRPELDRLGAHVTDHQVGADDRWDDVEQFDCGMSMVEGQQLDGLGGALVPAEHVVDSFAVMVHRHALGKADLRGEAAIGGEGEPEQWVVGPQRADGGNGQGIRETDREQRFTVGERTDHRAIGHHPIGHRRADGRHLAGGDQRRPAGGEDHDHPRSMRRTQGLDGTQRQLATAVQQGTVEVGGDQTRKQGHDSATWRTVLTHRAMLIDFDSRFLLTGN